MPGLNGTGPRGEGSRTGGGRGNCAAVVKDEVAGGAGRMGAGRGMGRGMGRGRGNCCRSLKGSGQDMPVTTIDKGKKEI